MTAGRSHARERLLDLLRSRAVLRGDFILSSGARSDVYLDARLVTLSAAGASLVGESFLAALPETVEAVAGLTMGADPIVSSICCVAGLQGREVDGFIVRKDAKGHGTGKRIEGPWREGLRVAIVDDTLTTGASALEPARVIREAGASVDAIYCLIDRQEGARERIEGEGFAFHAIFTGVEVLGS